VLSAVHPLSMTASQLVSSCCYGQTDCASEGVRVINCSNRAKATGYNRAGNLKSTRWKCTASASRSRVRLTVLPLACETERPLTVLRHSVLKKIHALRVATLHRGDFAAEMPPNHYRPILATTGPESRPWSCLSFDDGYAVLCTVHSTHGSSPCPEVDFRIVLTDRMSKSS